MSQNNNNADCIGFAHDFWIEIEKDLEFLNKTHAFLRTKVFTDEKSEHAERLKMVFTLFVASIKCTANFFLDCNKTHFTRKKS